MTLRQVFRVAAYAFAAGSVATSGCHLAEETDSGTLIVSAEMLAPATQGQNRLLIEVADADGQPIEAELEVVPHMPAHGHGSTETPEITKMDGPSYVAEPVTFHMAGHWQVTVTARRGSEHGVEVLDLEID